MNQTTGWRRHFPNALTMLRLVLAVAFFAALNGWRYGGPALWANIAIVLFILAAVTDALDGALARRWQVMSDFGRIMDPVCDKILVLGAFIYLAGPRFVMPDLVEQGRILAMAGGIYPWMVVVIIFRELLVTGVRSVAESRGAHFPSNWWGKWKMILQTIAIPAAIFVAANFDPADAGNRVIVFARDVLIWITLVISVVSGVPYITRYIAIQNKDARNDSGAADA
ncbi:MAG: CDP-diacylglycerol--glycerol-3-phosphate 3-phosphatidyltransferase [Phycisphaerales bacterium]